MIEIDPDKIKTVWFDLDDTLWDFRHNSHETLKEVYSKFKLERFWEDSESWSRDYHSVNDPLWADYAKGAITAKALRKRRFYDTFVAGGMNVYEAEANAEAADIFYLVQLGKKDKNIDGAIELLKSLKSQNFRIGILSNGFADVQKAKLTSSGLIDFIDFIITSDAAGINKPDVRIFRYAESLADVGSNHCIMIGDNGETDIAGALAAGWHMAVWFNVDNKIPGDSLCRSLSLPCTLSVVSDLREIDLKIG